MNLSSLCQAQQFTLFCGHNHGMTNSHDADNVSHITALANKFTESINTHKAEVELKCYLFSEEVNPQKIELKFYDGSVLWIKKEATCEMVQRVFGVHEEINLIYLPKEIVRGMAA